MAIVPPTKEDVLNAFYQLSPEDQQAVVEAVTMPVEEIEEEDEEQPHPGSPGWVTSEQLAGILLAKGQTPPTDEEVEQWIDDARMEKYGDIQKPS